MFTHIIRAWSPLGLVLGLLLLGCDGTESDLDPGADETAAFEQLTQETLREGERLSESYNRILSEAVNARSAGSNSKGTVYVPSGSNDALAAAIAQAGERGVVVLESGEHYESGTVAVTERVTLVGEPGARLVVDTQPLPVAPTMDPAIHVMDASHVGIWGIEIAQSGEIGGTAILAERAPHLVIGQNTIRGHQIAVAIDRSDHAWVLRNTVMIARTSRSVPGTVLFNGAHARFVSNTISNALGPGIFVGDEHGHVIDNETYGNFIGVLMCTPRGLPAPSGEVLAAETPATQWLLSHNNAHDNAAWGYLLIDEVNNNTFTRTNTASNNALYDVELAGDTWRFGFLAPFTFENKAFVGEGMTVKDCGVNNKVQGGLLVDTDVDPCF